MKFLRHLVILMLLLLAFGACTTNDAASLPLDPLHDEDEGVRRSAVRALEGTGSEGLATIEQVLAQDESPRVRWSAVWILPSFGEEAIPLLLQSLADEDDSVRRVAVNGLAEFAPEAEELLGPIASLATDSSAAVRTAVVTAIARFGEAAQTVLPQLVLFVGEQDFRTRREAMPLIERFLDEEEQIALLLEQLEHPDLQTREMAASSLARIGSSTVPHAVSLLQSESDVVVTQILWLFERLQKDAETAAEAVLPLLENTTHRNDAIRALVAMGTDLEEPLAQALASEGVTDPNRRAKDLIHRSGYRLALLAVDQRSYGESLSETLTLAGFEWEPITGEQIAQGQLQTSRFDALLVVDSPRFPADAMDGLDTFKRRGGDLLLLGGYPFSESEASLVHIEDYHLYDLPQVRTVKAHAQIDWFSQPPLFSGQFSGRSAVLSNAPRESGFIPVLTAYDQYGRDRGWAAGVLAHYGGAYRNSYWAFFGLQEDEFYHNPEFLPVLVSMLDQFVTTDLSRDTSIAEQQGSRTVVEITTPAPMRVLVTEDGSGFVYEDGTPFFMVGVNVFGPRGFHHFSSGHWQADVLEAMFQRMHQAGVNALRIRASITSAFYREPEHVQALIEFARRYGVYLLIEVGPDPEGTDQATIEERARMAAELFANEPIVLGYDLDNEPYPWGMASVTTHSGRTLGQIYPHQFGNYNRWVNPGTFSLFENLEGQMPVPPASIRRDFDNINNTIGAWIAMYTDIIRPMDPQALITVGYNNDYIAYPVHEVLDFVSNHIYPHNWARNHGGETVDYMTLKMGLTTMDRLASMWPDKPISVGEFGFSNGLEWRDDYLDAHTSSVMELMFFLYSLDKGYSGIQLWALDDWPQATLLRTWQSDSPLSQGRYGKFFYDGTLAGRPKPMAHAMRFLRQFIDAGHFGGSFTLRRVAGSEQAAYTYTHDNGLFIGDRAFTDPSISFTTKNGLVGNVMLMYDEETLTVMATNDAEVQIDVGAFVPALAGKELAVSGHYGYAQKQDGMLHLLLLEGLEITIHQQ